jgi:hypothetical protein
VAVRDCISHVSFNSEGLYEESEEMSKLPERIRKQLKEEGIKWDTSVAGESSKKTVTLLDDAEVFVARRPPRKPVCLRLDPFDLSMVKRIANRKGIPFTQLMSMWLHEKVEGEKNQGAI